MNHWNRIFWAFFVFIGLVIVFGTLFKALYIEILLGLVVIIVGIHKLGEERSSNNIEETQTKLNRSVDYIAHWMNSMYDFSKNLKNKHEYRLYHLDKKRADMDKKIEDNYRDLVRKVVNLENRMNELAYVGVTAKRPEIRSGRGTVPKTSISIATPGQIKVEKPKPEPGDKLADLSERQIGAIKVIRSRGKISTKEYTQLFKVSDRTAQNDLKGMMKRELIKRVGEGAKIHYVMSF